MKLAALILGCAVSPLFAAGTVQQTISRLGNTDIWVVTFNWTGDASSGSVPTTAAALSNCCQGYLVTQIVASPGSPAPTNGYSLAINDFVGADMLGGAGSGAMSSSAAQSFAAASSAPPINGTFSLVISGNSVASAKGVVSVYMAKPGTVNSAALTRALFGSASTANWLTLANAPFADARRYNFTPQAPSGSLSAGIAATVTLTPCPAGVNGTDTAHYLYIAGTGTPEPVLITGGTCTSNARSGTVQFTPANSHTSGYTIASGSSGIYEAIQATKSSGRYSVYSGPGALTIHGQLYLPPGVAARITIDSDLTFGSDIGANDGIWIDSCEACTIDVPGSVYYQGTTYAIRLNPKNPAPFDNIKNIQWSKIHFANVQSYPNGGSPGSGVPVAQANVRIVLEGDVASPVQGLVSHNFLEFGSLWGGLQSFIVDSAASTYPGWFEENIINMTQVVYFTQLGVRSCVASGTTVVCPNNIWNVTIVYGRDDGTGTAPQSGWSTGNNSAGGIWNLSSLSQPAGKVSLIFGSGTSNVSVRAGSIGGTITDSSGNFTNSFFLNGLQTYPSAGTATQAAGTSPYVCQNKQYVPMNVLVSGGTVSSIGLSTDGSSYVNSGTSGYYMLWPGMYMKVTHTGAPTMFLYCAGKTVCACN